MREAARRLEEDVRRSRTLRDKLAEAVPEGRQAGQVLTETRLRDLRGLADAE